MVKNLEFKNFKVIYNEKELSKDILKKINKIENFFVFIFLVFAVIFSFSIFKIIENFIIEMILLILGNILFTIIFCYFFDKKWEKSKPNHYYVFERFIYYDKEDIEIIQIANDFYFLIKNKEESIKKYEILDFNSFINEFYEIEKISKENNNKKENDLYLILDLTKEEIKIEVY